MLNGSPPQGLSASRRLVLLAATGFLLMGPPAGAGTRPGHDPERRTETDQEHLERLRSRARSVFLRAPGSKLFEASQNPGEKTGPTPRKTRSLSPEVQASGGVFGTQSETSVAVFGSHVVVGFNQINGNRGSGVAYSTDGGATFTDTGGLPAGGGTNRLFGDPAVTACGDGTFYYSSIYIPDPDFTESRLAVSVGTFTGAVLNWSTPIIAATSVDDFLDKEWLTCDRATNTLYMTYTRFVNGNVPGGATTELRIEIIRSTNGGATWTAPVVLENTFSESLQICYVTVGPNGEVYAMWERGLDDLSAVNTKLEFRRSFNFVSTFPPTFDPKVVVRTMTPSFFPASVGYNRETTLEIGTLAVDTSTGPNRGNLYAIWVERESGGGVKRDVFVAASADQGAAWSAPVKVNDDPPGSDQVMPWISINSAGTLEAAWYDYRNWTGMYTADVYAARSTDGGASFGPNFRVTTVPTSWFVPLTFTPNFGDYSQCVSEGTGFYPSWADGRNGEIDVFASHVPTATCGNGTLEAFEQCDDGNTLDGDSCSGACAATPCGNGTLEGAEQCDDGNVRSGDGCSQTCRFEVCGDGIIQRNNHEECDDGNLTDADGCSATCQIELDKMAWIADERSRLLLESTVTGRVMHFGDPGFHEMGDLAFDAAGNLFGATGFNPGLSIGLNGSLVSLATQGLPSRGSLIGGTGRQAIQAIDFHPSSGVLYGIAVDNLGTSSLVTLDPNTGAVLSTIGGLGLDTARAMAFDAAGVLYVSGRVNTAAPGVLYSVNPATAVKTPIGTSIPYLLSGMDFAPDGSLYGVTQRDTGTNSGLVLVNKSTGTGTLLFSLGALNQQGIRFAPQVAVDHDLDGIHDAADCAPFNGANPPPGLTANLHFVDATGINFAWSPATTSLFHNSYHGTITGPMGGRLPGSVFDHVCLESADAQRDGDLVSSDGSAPPSGTVYYYLTSGEGCGEGALDIDASHPISNANPCPTPP